MGPSSLNAQIFPLREPRGALRAARYAGRAPRAGVLRTARYRYRWSDPTYENQLTAPGTDWCRHATPHLIHPPPMTCCCNLPASATLLLLNHV
eukprot:scaffold67307_cov48-Phaeocystis_antarctica.AAC.4